MKLNREIFSIASATRLALVAGRSPVCWRRDLTRDASQISALSRTCDWVGRLTSVSAVLRDGPLFGRGIADLFGTPTTKDDAGKGARHAQPRPARTQSPPLIPRKRSQSGVGDSVGRSRSDARNVDTSFGQVDSVRGRDSEALPQSRKRSLSQPSGTEVDAEAMDSRTFLPASSSNHHRAKVGELPQRASRDLLESCANARQQVHLRRGGQRAADAESATTASPRSSPVARPEIARDDEAHLHRRQLTVSAKPRATFAPVLQPSGDFQAEAESLNKTFAQRLVRRTVNAIRHLQPSANNETQANECLSEQWSTTLDGAAVSSNSLVEIIAGGMNAIRMKQSKDMMNESSVVAHPRPGARHETSSAHSPRSLDSEMILRRERHLSSHSSGTDVDAEASVITDRDSAPRLRADAPTPREFLPASFSNRHPRVGSFDDPFGDEREGGKEAVGFSNVERIAPPALAPSLPSLTPSPEEAQTDVTSVLPLASEIARQGARKEAESPEDLDALAAKIKFILDEQARRHGIDV